MHNILGGPFRETWVITRHHFVTKDLVIGERTDKYSAELLERIGLLWGGFSQLTEFILTLQIDGDLSAHEVDGFQKECWILTHGIPALSMLVRKQVAANLPWNIIAQLMKSREDDLWLLLKRVTTSMSARTGETCIELKNRRFKELWQQPRTPSRRVKWPPKSSD